MSLPGRSYIELLWYTLHFKQRRNMLFLKLCLYLALTFVLELSFFFFSQRRSFQNDEFQFNHGGRIEKYNSLVYK